MNVKGILIIVLMIILSFVFSKYYVCNIRCLCNEDKVLSQNNSVAAPQRNSILLAYSWMNVQPNIDPLFYETMDSILKVTSPAHKIVIVGEYYTKENSHGSNIGLDRANVLKNNLAERYDTSRFIAKSNSIATKDSTDGVLFNAIHFETFVVTAEEESILAAIANSYETPEPVLIQKITTTTDNITKSPAKPYYRDINSLEINFPKGIGDKTVTKSMFASLDKIANDLRLSKGEVLVTGFADIKGNENVNLGLALERADLIKQALIRKGIDEKKIFIESLEMRSLDNSNDIGNSNEGKVIIKKL